MPADGMFERLHADKPCEGTGITLAILRQPVPTQSSSADPLPGGFGRLPDFAGVFMMEIDGFYDADRGGGLWMGKHYRAGDQRYGDSKAHEAAVAMALTAG